MWPYRGRCDGRIDRAQAGQISRTGQQQLGGHTKHIARALKHGHKVGGRRYVAQMSVHDWVRVDGQLEGDGGQASAQVLGGETEAELRVIDRRHGHAVTCLEVGPASVVVVDGRTLAMRLGGVRKAGRQRAVVALKLLARFALLLDGTLLLLLLELLLLFQTSSQILRQSDARPFYERMLTCSRSRMRARLRSHLSHLQSDSCSGLGFGYSGELRQ